MMPEPECTCAAREHVDIQHSRKCAVSQWERFLYDVEVEDTAIGVPSSVFVYNEAGDMLYKEDDTEQQALEAEVVAEPASDDAPEKLIVPEFFPSAQPDEWTEEDWTKFDTFLDTLTPDDAAHWEDVALAMMIGEQIEDLSNSHLCTCGAISGNGPYKNKPQNGEVSPGFTHIASCPGSVTSGLGINSTSPVPCTCDSERYGGHHTLDCPSESSWGSTNTVDKYAVCTCNAAKYDNKHLGNCPLYPKTKSATIYKKSCFHDRDLIALTDELSVYVSAWRDVKYADDERVNIGIYAYDSWSNRDTLVTPGLGDVSWIVTQPRLTEAVILNWTDFNAYDNLPHLKSIVEWTLGLMGEGKTFELGCMGAHGRTGTLLACFFMSTNADMTPATAINTVREKHCKSGIESTAQIEMVADWYKLWHGHENWRGSKTERKAFNKTKGSKSYGSYYKNPYGGSVKGPGTKGSTGFQPPVRIAPSPGATTPKGGGK